jgi:hypothetical protein
MLCSVIKLQGEKGPGAGGLKEGVEEDLIRPALRDMNPLYIRPILDIVRA